MKKEISKPLFIKKEGKSKSGHKTSKYKCFCGKEFICIDSSIKNNRIKSCGCLLGKNMRIDGRWKTRLYKIYLHIKDRCFNPKNQDYKDYMGRGITLSEKWSTFESFREWSLKNGYSDNLTIDRIENNKGYSPDNCRWTSKSVQCINRRKFKNTKSKYRGVRTDGKAWIAKINANNISYHLGSYQTEVAAALLRRFTKDVQILMTYLSILHCLIISYSKGGIYCRACQTKHLCKMRQHF